MRSLFFSFFFIIFFEAFATPCPLEDSEITKESKLPQSVQQLYKSSRYLGIGVVDHEKFPGFVVLKTLLETYGFDPQLKTVVIEDSAIFAPLYEKLSLTEIQSNSPEFKMIPPTGQFLEIAKNILPLIRRINQKRGHDPLIVVPVDGMDHLNAKMQMHYDGEIQRPLGLEDLFSDLSFYHYVMSINREKQTAENFYQQVVLRYPKQKSIVIYHASHIFDELWAYGYEVTGRTTEIRYDYLGWMGFLLADQPALKNSYKKILVDTPTSQNPKGSVCWPETLFEETSKNSWFSTDVEGLSSFNKTSFFGRYREGTISSQAASLADFYLLSTF